jgi:hypothetical protein
MTRYEKTAAALCGLLCLGNVQAQSCKPESIPADAPANRFVVNADGTVEDTRTGLMWKRCSEGQTGSACAGGQAASYTWKAALDYVQAFNRSGGFAGHADWRLPNVNELLSLVERRCFDPAINLTAFPATPSNFYWSSSPYAGDGSFAWFVNFSDGFDFAGSKGFDFSVRLVRSGQ